MPVFDFSNDTSEIKEEVVSTYTTFSSNVDHATIECPILILSNKKKQGASFLWCIFWIKISRQPLNLRRRWDSNI